MAKRVFRTILVVFLALAVLAPSGWAAEAPASVAAVAAAAKPSVVGLLVTLPSDDPSDPEDSHAAGTGFVFRDGYIITNAHVVADAKEVQVLWSDKSITTVADVKNNVWWDEASDIGVVKADTRGRKPLAFADSDQLTVGEVVIAIGNPLGFRLGNTVTTGILSGVGRAVGSGLPFLQMDAAINPGNSGGPLFNAQGLVIGINSAKFAEVGVEGLALAIPSNTALAMAAELIAKGKVERVWLGIAMSEDWKGYFGVPNQDGITIALIVPDGPAGKAGLKVGDKLTKIDSHAIGTEDDVYSYLLKKKPGDQVTLTVKRRGQVLTTRVTLLAREQGKGQDPGPEPEQGRGVLVNLTPDQVRDAAEYGRSLYGRSLRALTENYAAISGSQRAVLYTEFSYVARRVVSAYWQAGKRPSNDFVQSMARQIRGKVEVEFEVQANSPDFFRSAVAVLKQGDRSVPGALVGTPGYAVAADGTSATGQAWYRFDFIGLDPAADVEVLLRLDDGTSYSFHYVLKDLR